MEWKLGIIVCNVWGFFFVIQILGMILGMVQIIFLLCNRCNNCVFCIDFEYLIMLEGLELYKNSQFVNRVCKGFIFSGKIVKLVVSVKNLDVEFFVCDYFIYLELRGKEMVFILIFLNLDSKGK